MTVENSVVKIAGIDAPLLIFCEIISDILFIDSELISYLREVLYVLYYIAASTLSGCYIEIYS